MRRLYLLLLSLTLAGASLACQAVAPKIQALPTLPNLEVQETQSLGLPEPSETAEPTQPPEATEIQEPVETAEPSETPAPTQLFESLTPAPATMAPVSETPEPTETIGGDLQAPQGTPLSTWKGAPIMPGALHGEEIPGGYSFTTQASVAEVESYYKQEMVALGWKIFATTSGSDQARLLLFQKDGEMLTISIITQPGEENTYVMLITS